MARRGKKWNRVIKDVKGVSIHPLLYGKCSFDNLISLDIPDGVLYEAYSSASPSQMARILIRSLFTGKEISQSCATLQHRSKKPPCNQEIYARIKGNFLIVQFNFEVAVLDKWPSHTSSTVSTAWNQLSNDIKRFYKSHKE